MGFIEYIEERYSVEHVSGGRELKLSGQCPFCLVDRSDLRLYINIEKGVGQCFHCDSRFNGVKFVMAAEKVSYAKACQLMDDDDIYVRTDAIKLLPEIPYPPCVDIVKGSFVAEYLLKRHVSQDMIDTFGVQFCIDNIVVDGRRYYTADRVMFPLHDVTGAKISWQGRDILGKSMAKYLLPETFDTSLHLFNAHRIQLNPDYLILTEGMFDVTGWHHAGFKNAVASYGKKISAAQIDILAAINPKVLFLAWDSDAALKKYEFAEKYGHKFNCRITDLRGKDSDECHMAELTDAMRHSKRYDWNDKIALQL